MHHRIDYSLGDLSAAGTVEVNGWAAGIDLRERWELRTYTGKIKAGHIGLLKG
jgi:hypothetical protein